MSEDILLATVSRARAERELESWSSLLAKMGLDDRYCVYAEPKTLARTGIYLGRKNFSETYGRG